MSTFNEISHLGALTKLAAMTTKPNEGLDRVTRLAAELFKSVTAMIVLPERHHIWFARHIGFEFGGTCQDGSPCADVTASADAMSFRDLQAEARYADCPVVKLYDMRFYAGAPLITHQGKAIGTLCVFGSEPREATPEQLASLVDLASLAMSQVEMQVTRGRVDPISGIPNRNQFLDDVEDTARDCPGEERMVVLVEIAGSDEMDQAAQVMGSRYFDEVVLAAAETIRSIIGPDRSLYHVAATQFAFLAPLGVDATEYEVILRNRTKVNHETLESRFLLSPRLGVAGFTLGDIEPREALRRAHSAAQAARALGDAVQFYSKADDDANARRYWILREFKSAIADGQLHLVYQPRIDLRSGYGVGVEALVRWTHPLHGLISPAEFLPIIERTSHMRSLTDWVVEAAFAQMAKWRAEGSRLCMSINISARDVEDGEFVLMLQEALLRHDVPAEAIELELTEGTVMQESGNGLAKLKTLSAMGFSLAIDDFGTGYSSLSYLQKLPVDVVKIDRSFLLDLATDDKARTLVRAMISLSHDLGYRVVAEGIEDTGARDFLFDAGCDEAQGYFYGRPMLPAAIDAWFFKREELVA